MAFCPPEKLSKRKMYDKSDVWSLGIFFYYLLFGKNPFGKDIDSLKTLIE